MALRPIGKIRVNLTANPLAFMLLLFYILFNSDISSAYLRIATSFILFAGFLCTIRLTRSQTVKINDEYTTICRVYTVWDLWYSA